MHKKIKLGVAIVFFWIFLNLIGFTVGASEIPVYNLQQGSISVTSIPDTVFTIYQVGKVKENHGNIKYVLTKEFKESEEKFENITSEKLAKRLDLYAKEKKLKGTEETANSQGDVVFSKLQAGLYLIQQKGVVEGYYPISPFLVSIPMKKMDGSGWIYDVDASPKIQIRPCQTPSEQTSSILIQTGQLHWPIFVLVILAMVLFSIGWVIRKKDEKKNQ